jgi:flagellar biosynthetic protein FliO
MTMDVVRQVLGVVLVFASLGGTLWLLRRSGTARWRMPGRRRAAGGLELIERLALSPHHAVHLVRLGDRALVVASHASGCTLLESLPWREYEAARKETPQ